MNTFKYAAHVTSSSEHIEYAIYRHEEPTFLPTSPPLSLGASDSLSSPLLSHYAMPAFRSRRFHDGMPSRHAQPIHVVTFRRARLRRQIGIAYSIRRDRGHTSATYEEQRRMEAVYHATPR